MIRFLTISLLLTLLLTSCGTYKYPTSSGIRSIAPKEVNTYYADTAQAYVYRTRLTAFQKEINGNLVVKSISPDTHRLALLSDFGQTLFDISVFSDTYVVHYAMADLNKKKVVKEVASLFRLLTSRRFATEALIFPTQQYFPVYVANGDYYTYEERNLVEIKHVKGSKERFSVRFSDVQDALPQQIDIKHKRYPLSLSLQLDSAQSEL